MQPIVVRRPLVAIVVPALSAGSFVLYVAFGLAWALAHGEDIGGGSAAIVMAAAAGALGYRLATLSLRADGQKLVIHNCWRTRRVPIAQVEGFDLGKATAGSLWTVRVLTSRAIIPIDVIGVSRFFGRVAARNMEKLERQQRDLASWVAAAKSRT